MSSLFQKIQSKEDFRKFVRKDLAVRGMKQLPWLYRIRKPIVHYTILLRKVEYLQNSKHGFLFGIWCRFMQLRLKLLGAKLGFSITPNTFGPGLYLVHWGSIVVSSEAHIGANARVHSCVNISGAPVIGENVYLAPGAVVVGDITVGDNVSIGANSVVTTSFPDNVIVLGSPARVVKIKASNHIKPTPLSDI